MKINKNLLRVINSGRRRLNRPYEMLTTHRTRKLLDSVVAEVSSSTRPVFIIGPPRCGSTLLYQAMTHYFNFCYFSNEMMREPRQIPALMLSRHCSVDYFSDFENRYGITSQANGPHESYPFWRRFYPKGINDYVQGQPVNEQSAREIRKTIQFLVEHYNRPFICKNIETCLRLQSLREIIPNAFFIVLKRNPIFTAASILKGRSEHMGGRDVWMGMKPETYLTVKEEAVFVQVSQQILEAYRCFYKDVDQMNYTEVYYEDFCEQPQHVLDGLKETLSGAGIELEHSGRTLPSLFQQKQTTNLSSKDIKELHNVFAESDVFQKYLCRYSIENSSFRGSI